MADNGAGDTNSATGTIGLSITVPATAGLGQTFSRFRWSSQTGLDPSAITGHNGEVEDYASTLLGIPILSTTKTSAIYAPTSFTSYFIPANDVIYTIATANTGLVATDANSIFTLDSLPAQVEVYIGDFDGVGPAAGTILFTTQIGAVLTYTAGTNLKFSSASTAPSTFAACTYVPTVSNTYDAAIRHICVNPKGALAAGSPAPGYTIQFRARIK